MRKEPPAGVGAAALLLVLTGCASAPAAADVGLVARRFADAVRQQDGAAACALLSQRARESVESSGGACADELSRRELRVGTPGAATVWGGMAQVPAAPDTLFLGQYTNGWRVTGAGCRPRGEEMPYECAIGGS
jgi:hypothetical protein